MDLTIGLGSALTIGAVLVSGGVTLGMLRGVAASFRAHETEDRLDFSKAHGERSDIQRQISDMRADVARLEGRP